MISSYLFTTVLHVKIHAMLPVWFLLSSDTNTKNIHWLYKTLTFTTPHYLPYLSLLMFSTASQCINTKKCLPPHTTHFLNWVLDAKTETGPHSSGHLHVSSCEAYLPPSLSAHPTIPDKFRPEKLLPSQEWSKKLTCSQKWHKKSTWK